MNPAVPYKSSVWQKAGLTSLIQWTRNTTAMNETTHKITDAEFQDILRARIEGMISEHNDYLKRASALDAKIEAATVLLNGQGGKNGVSFSERVREILATFAVSASPSRVATRLKKRVPEYKKMEIGPLVRRVNTDLFRMSRSKKLGVVRVSTGRYRMRK